MVAILAREFSRCPKTADEVSGNRRVPAIQIRSTSETEGRAVEAGIRIPSEKLYSGDFLGRGLRRLYYRTQEKKNYPVKWVRLEIEITKLGQLPAGGSGWVYFHSESGVTIFLLEHEPSSLVAQPPYVWLGNDSTPGACISSSLSHMIQG